MSVTSFESAVVEFKFETSVADETAGFEDSEKGGSLQGRKELATTSETQIFDMGTSIMVRSNDMNPIIIISTMKSKSKIKEDSGRERIILVYILGGHSPVLIFSNAIFKDFLLFLLRNWILKPWPTYICEHTYDYT